MASSLASNPSKRKPILHEVLRACSFDLKFISWILVELEEKGSHKEEMEQRATLDPTSSS